jgi:transposase InsO family protein
MTAHSQLFTERQAIRPESILITNGDSISAIAAGTARIAVISDSGVSCVDLSGALLAPALKTNLISVLRLVRQGLVVTFQNDAVVVLDKQQRILARGVKEHGLFRLVQPPTADYTSGTPIYAFAAIAEPSLNTWHHRFGHLSQQAIRWLAASRLVGGLELESGSREHLCDACAAGKAHRLPFPASPSRSTALLDLVHSDLMQLNTPSLGGARYLFTLLDDHSKKLWIYFLKRNSDAFQHFKEWQALVERQSGLKVKALRSDNGGEYTAGQFQSHLRSEGISSQFSVAYTPQQNGAAERLNRTVQDAVRTMLVQSGLPSSLWAEAVSYIVYTKNHSPHRAINDVPERLWSAKAPGVAHLRPFGCRAWKYVAEPHQRAVKLAPRGLARIFVGYSADHMAYRLWDPATRKVELARDVQFFENVFPAAGDHSDAQELVFDVVSFPDEGSQRRGDSADGSAPSNPPESVSDDSEHLIQLPVVRLQ